jgi:hypothetical protein
MLSPPEAPDDEHVRDVILRNGRTLRLRPPELADTRSLVNFFRSLDDRSRYLRFHGVVHIDAHAVEGCWIPTGPFAAP